MSSRIRFVMVDADLAEGELAELAETINQAIRQHPDGGKVLPASVPIETPALPAPARVDDAPPVARPSRGKRERSKPPPRAVAAPPTEEPDAEGKVACPYGCGARINPRGLGPHRRGCTAFQRDKKNEPVGDDDRGACASRVSGAARAGGRRDTHGRDAGDGSGGAPPGGRPGAERRGALTGRQAIPLQQCPHCGAYTTLSPCEKCHIAIPGARP